MHQGLHLTTSAGYLAKHETYVIVGQILAGTGTTTVEAFKAISPPQTSAGSPVTDPVTDPPAQAGALSELRRLSGLSWEQLAHVLGVSRRTLHFWASGKPMARSNEEHLQRVLGVVRASERGSTAATRTALLETRDGQHNAVDLLAAREYKRASSATSRLSTAVRTSRAPSPPETLVGALHDRVHQDLGPSRPARSVKVDRRR
jgi:transcriptional regulator with XRE-family HTH domain